MTTLPPKPTPTTVALFRSGFRRPWYGILIASVRGDCGDFLIVKDARGKKMQRRMVKRLSLGWMQPAGRFDPTALNPDWLTPYYKD